MTLIIGMKCKDGIVVGADTLASIPTCAGTDLAFSIDKIHKISSNTLFAAAGAISTIQRIHDVVAEYKGKLSQGLTTSLRDAIVHDLAVVYSNRMEVFRTLHRNDEGGWSADVIIATTKKRNEDDCKGKNGGDRFVLWHIAKDLNDEIADCMNYYTTGIGDLSASTLLKLWHDKEITVREGIPLVRKVIQTVGEINSLVNTEANIWFLDKGGVHKENQADNGKDG